MDLYLTLETISSSVVESVSSVAEPPGMAAMLPYMGKGMAAIFIVTLVIIGSITLLNKLTSKKK